MAEVTMVSRSAITPSSGASTLTLRTQLAKVIESDVFLWDPNMNPMISLLTRAKGKKKKFKESFQYYWPEDEYKPNVVCINGEQSAAEATVDVDSGASVAAGNVLAAQAADGTIETMLVTSVSTNTLTVTRGLGGTAVTLTDGMVLTNLGDASADAGTAPESIITIPAEKYNYLQVMRTAVEATSKMRAAKKYYPTGDYLMKQLKKKGFEHSRDLEMAFLLGHRAASVSSYLPRLTTQGLWERMSSDADSDHIWNVNGTLTEATFLEHALEPIQNTKGRKVLFAGKKILNALSTWAKGEVRRTVDDTVEGLRINKYRIPILEDIDVIYHPWMDRQVEPSGSVQEGVRKDWGVIVDLDNIHYCYGEEFVTVGIDDKKITDTLITPVNQASNPLDSKYEIISVFGTQIMHPNSHMIFYGVEGYA